MSSMCWKENNTQTDIYPARVPFRSKAEILCQGEKNGENLPPQTYSTRKAKEAL